MTLAVACITDDIEYATRMVSYMKSSPIYHSWRLQLFTSVQKFQPREAFGQLDLILVDEGMYAVFAEHFPQLLQASVQSKSISYSQGVPIIVQLVSPGHGNKYEKSLMKYQPLSSLLHMLHTIIEGERQQVLATAIHATDECVVIGVGSSIAQCGKSLFALHLTNGIASHNQRVFYFNLELWNTTQRWLLSGDSPSTATYSDFLYNVKSNAEQAKIWFSKHRQFDQRLRCDTLLPFAHIEDRQQLSKEDAQLMLKTIAESGHYDYIVLDLSAGYDDWNLTLLSECNFHYMMMLANEEWLMKHEMSLAYARMKWSHSLENLEAQAIKILIDGKSKQQQFASDHYHVTLPYIEQWQEQSPHILHSSVYRAAVEHCVQKFMNKGSFAS